MPNLTPIPITVEEHERLTKVKHGLEANSWREMLMKLCDIYEKQSQTEQPPTEDIRPLVEKNLDEILEEVSLSKPDENPEEEARLKLTKEELRQVVADAFKEALNGQENMAFNREPKLTDLHEHLRTCTDPDCQIRKTVLNYAKQEEAKYKYECPECNRKLKEIPKECPHCHEEFDIDSIWSSYTKEDFERAR